MRVQTAWVLAIAFSGGLLVQQAQANEKMTADDLRLYCGYVDSLADPKMQKMRPKKRDKKIARMAKIKLKKLKDIIARGKTWGEDCSGIIKLAEGKIMESLQATRVKGRVEFVEVRGEQWDQMVVRARWKGDEDRFLEEEAAAVAWATYKEFPMVHTLAVAAYDPLNPEKILFEGIITNARMGNIQESRIESFADTRYIKLFDNKKFANPR